MSNTQDFADAFRAAMSRTAAGVAIIATDGPGGRSGATVSSFSSLSLEPPSVLVCIHLTSHTLAAIRRNRVFCVNVLREDQAAIAERFARDAEPRAARFALGAWTQAASGAPMLDGAVAHLDCRLAQEFVYGSHAIVVGEASSALSHEGRPLVYSARAFHRLP